MFTIALQEAHVIMHNKPEKPQDAAARSLVNSELASSLTLLDRSIDDIKAGRVRPAKAAIQAIADELNLTLSR